MSDYPMLISNKLHSFRNFYRQSYHCQLFMQTFSDNSSLFRLYSSNMNLLLAYLCCMITNFY